MTPEAINKAIAEWCGWKYSKIVGEADLTPKWQLQDNYKKSGCLSPGTPWQVNYIVSDKPDDTEEVDLRLVPNYYHDLNAVHEAEKKLFVEQWKEYTLYLNSDITQMGNGIMKSICHATSAQRCEALLRTLGLWRDEE